MSIITTTTTDIADQDYFWLIAQIQSWMHRTDMTASMPMFILVAERRIARMLKSSLQDARGTISTVAGIATASLPSALLSVQSLSIANVVPSLSYMTPAQLDEHYVMQEAGAPRHYTVIGDLVRFGPIPDAVYSVSCTYEAKPLALTAEEPTNALLTEWPDVYLFGALIEAADWAGDDASLIKWQAKFKAAIDGINLIDWHKGGPMRVRSDVRSA